MLNGQMSIVERANQQSKPLRLKSTSQGITTSPRFFLSLNPSPLLSPYFKTVALESQAALAFLIYKIWALLIRPKPTWGEPNKSPIAPHIVGSTKLTLCLQAFAFSLSKHLVNMSDPFSLVCIFSKYNCFYSNTSQIQ